VRRSTIFGRQTPGVELRSPFPILAAGILSIVAYVLLQLISAERSIRYTDEMIQAAGTMQRATAITREFCDSAGIEIDETDDPNRTCIIGPELTPLMTTLGHLDAKRTTTDPAMASLIVHLLDRAGVSAGDTIAIGSSASFPALLVATLAAAEAMDVHPIPIISLGSSTYGATNPDFNLLDIYTLLLNEGVLLSPPAAVSLGGSEDVGRGFDSDLKVELLMQIETGGVPFISDPDLRSNVAKRTAVYDGTGSGTRISAFVNAGGSFANLGTSALALRLEPGLNTDLQLPPEEERGVLFEMAARDVPVIHLLFIRGLALRYGFTWDPIPLREPGEMALHADRSYTSGTLWLVGIPYLVVVTILLGTYASSTNQRPHTAPELVG
jgi:poly-gamma-glutamate system protein